MNNKEPHAWAKVRDMSDLESLARDNDYMIRMGLNYLPDEMIDSSITDILRVATGLSTVKKSDHYSRTQIIGLPTIRNRAHAENTVPRNTSLYLSENVYNLCSSDDEDYV